METLCAGLVGIMIAASIYLILDRNLIRFIFGLVLAGNAVNLLLFTINVLTSPGSLWFYWPLMGWGIAVALHALRVFGTGGRFGAAWEERKINELMEQGGKQ